MDKKNKNPNVPNLRFSSFADPFRIYTLKEVLQRISFPVTVDENKLYYQIGIRSHSKGIFYKEAEIGKQIGNKRIFWIEPNCLILNIVFAWEQAVAKTSEKEVGMVASHRFPMYKVLNNSLDYIVDFFKTEKGKQLLQMASPGGAGRNKTLNQDFFLNSKIYLPSLNEQLKTSELIELIEDRIETQIKIIDDLLTVKNGISNKLFKLQQIELSNHYLSEYLIEGDKTAVDTSCYKKITVKLNNQGLAFSELNREMADTRPFYVRHKGELIIGKQNYFNGSIAIVTEQFDNCICSNAIMSFKIKGIYSDFLYYQISNNNYLNSQSYKANGTGQKELSEKEFLNFKIWCPQLEVQQKIVNCFKSLDLKIENEKAILNSYFREKSYLLNNMFI